MSQSPGTETPATSRSYDAPAAAADDTNLWFITSPNRPGEIQIDSHPGGQPPFSIESDQHNQRIETTSVEHAARTINQWLSLPG